jgi:cell division protein FtsX
LALRIYAMASADYFVEMARYVGFTDGVLIRFTFVAEGAICGCTSSVVGAVSARSEGARFASAAVRTKSSSSAIIAA